MSEHFKQVTIAQFEAALCMLHECIRDCPQEHWDGPIAKYPFWQVAYHTLCFVDFYLAPSESDFRPREQLHPRGMDELNDEYPSRRFTQAELLDYVSICRQKLRDVIGSESAERLAGPSGFSRLKFSRAELHLYGMRHVQHHTGQLGVFLRRVGIGVEANWVRSGWR